MHTPTSDTTNTDPAAPDSAGAPDLAAGRRPDPTTARRAADLLRQLVGPDARLRDDQAAAVSALVDDRDRVLLVQRTGWGKSAVYWIATALRRADGGGPTLVISPLLALMRDQVAAARRLGLAAETINSANVDDWSAVTARLDADEVDVLLISPERLNAAAFRDRVGPLAQRLGLFVIDEAHCVSDWGHDFRPDYRRLRDVLDALPARTPVLACTATANARVTEDVAVQLGAAAGPARTLRGRLRRASLRLSVVAHDDAARRYAWLAGYVGARRDADGRAGVIYALTRAEAERCAEWLRIRGLDVPAYTSDRDAQDRQELERALLTNEVDALVATSALGMGYDKPDLPFVVHLGAPSSPVAYYQQIGRAGRAIEDADVVLLPTGADEAIWEHFDVGGVPTRADTTALLDRLDRHEPMSIPALERAVNLRRSRLTLLLKVLDVDGAVRRVGSGWVATGQPWTYDAARYRGLVAARRREHAAMRRLSAGEVDGCLMAYLADALDDPDASPCGRCQHCTGWQPAVETEPDVADAARDFLRARDVLVRPRRRWPPGLAEVRGTIPEPRRPAIGRALAAGDDSGWGEAVERVLAASRPDAPRADDDALAEVIDGLVAVLARWRWDTRPVAFVPLPDDHHTPLVSTVTDRLAALGRLPRIDALDATAGPRHDELANGPHRARNALARLARTDAALPPGPVVVVTAAVDTGWWLTAATWRLTSDAPRTVLPLALRTRA